MPRLCVTSIALVAGLAALSACHGSKSSGGNVTMRDMEVVDGTANDAMVDLDNTTLDGTALENTAAAIAANAPAPAPKSIAADQNAAQPKADAAE